MVTRIFRSQLVNLYVRLVYDNALNEINQFASEYPSKHLIVAQQKKAAQQMELLRGLVNQIQNQYVENLSVTDHGKPAKELAKISSGAIEKLSQLVLEKTDAVEIRQLIAFIEAIYSELTVLKTRFASEDRK